MTNAKRIAVLDLGKTNARMILCDLETRKELDIRRMKNSILPGPPFPHIDVAAQEAFVLAALREFAAQGPLVGILPVAHGATVALTDGEALQFPVLDYECDGPDGVGAAYDAIRPPFSVTGSPRMRGGLNIGAQMFWLRHAWPETYAKVRRALFWPQYWSWRLSGQEASEISYVTGHSDLWSLADGAPIGTGQMGQLVAGLFAPLRPAAAPLGPIRADLAAANGLPPGLTVFNGVHDSSLALVPYGRDGKPCTVLSTGTWLTAFAIGVNKMPEAAAGGVMASLDIRGNLVPNFRFMAGKAFDTLLEARPGLPQHDAPALEIVGTDTGFALRERATGHPADLRAENPQDRATKLGQIIATMALEGMRGIGASGPLHLTGPLADNRGFVDTMRREWPAPVILHDYIQSITEQVAELFDHPVDRR